MAYFGPSFYTFVHQDHGTRVDVQWRVTEKYFSFSLEDNRRKGRLVPVTVAGRLVLTFDPMDMLLILCAHGTKHQWQELKWICDVAELVRAEKESIIWEKLQEEASREGASRMLNLGLYLARDLLGAEVPANVSNAIDKDFGRSWVVTRILSDLTNQPLRSWAAHEKVGFYLKTMDRWQDRVRFCRSFLSQCLHTVVTPTLKDRELLSLPPRLYFLYHAFRPLRLAVKYLWFALRRLTGGRRGTQQTAYLVHHKSSFLKSWTATPRSDARAIAWVTTHLVLNREVVFRSIQWYGLTDFEWDRFEF